MCINLNKIFKNFEKKSYPQKKVKNRLKIKQK